MGLELQQPQPAASNDVLKSVDINTLNTTNNDNVPMEIVEEGNHKNFLLLLLIFFYAQSEVKLKFFNLGSIENNQNIRLDEDSESIKLLNSSQNENSKSVEFMEVVEADDDQNLQLGM